nr:EOG090X09AY [Triops cancriformis]
MDCRVLSIQSHVVSGYVGNKSATFPLQVLGFEVDTINSVQFSNHTGYGKWKGTVLQDQELADLLEGLKINNLNHYTHLLTGYVGSPSFLRQLIEVVRELKNVNPNLIYVCDPVMGDNGELYVPKELLPLYRDEVIPLADVITPNQFEAELITEIKIQSEEDALKAMDIFHDKGVRTVVISSSEIGKSDDKLNVYASSRNGDGVKQRLRIVIPRLPYIFTGTGDLFASLLLAYMQKFEGNLVHAVQSTIGTLQNVIKRTIDYALSKVQDGKPSSKELELRLIQSKNDIENPRFTYEAVVL